MNRHSMDLFLAACGLAEPLCLQVKYPKEPQSVHRLFHQPFLRIGRAPGSDLLIDHPLVSPCHLYVQVIAGHVFCADLGPNPTTSESPAPRLSGWLGPKHAFRICGHAIKIKGGGIVSYSAPLGVEWPLLPDVTEPGLTPTLQLLNAVTPRPPRRLRRVLTLIGQDEACAIRLLGQSVSDFHCALLTTPLGVWVIDLLGQHGVYVNGQRVSYARLMDGDQLQVGKFLYSFRGVAPLTEKALPEQQAWPNPRSSGGTGLVQGTETGPVDAVRPAASRPEAAPYSDDAVIVTLDGSDPDRDAAVLASEDSDPDWSATLGLFGSEDVPATTPDATSTLPRPDNWAT